MGWHGVVCKVDCFTSFAKTARVIARNVATRQSMVGHRGACEVDCFAALAMTVWLNDALLSLRGRRPWQFIGIGLVIERSVCWFVVIMDG